MPTPDRGLKNLDNWSVASETKDLKDIVESTKNELISLATEVENKEWNNGPFETITSPESINSKNVCAITRELFEKILRRENLTPYSQVIDFLNERFSKIVEANDKQQIKEFADAFGVAVTTLTALIKSGTLQAVLSGTYNWPKKYEDAVRYVFENLFPGEILLIESLMKRAPKDILKEDYGIDVDDHYDPDKAKTILENHAKRQTLVSLKQNYFWKRLQTKEDKKRVAENTTEIVNYVIIDDKDYYKREEKQFNNPAYEKQVLEDLREIYLSEQIAQVNRQLQLAWIENTIN